MQKYGLKTAGGLMATLLATSAIAFGADQTQVKGMITGRTGETLIVRGADGETTVVLTDSTRTKDDRGLFGLEKLTISSVVLMPGLKVKVDGAMNGDKHLVAKTITVDGDDLESAEMIQAGLHPTAQQVAENVQRLEGHSQKLGAHGEQIAANGKGIQANQQGIAGNQQQIQESMKDIEENSNRFSTLADYDVKGQATLHFNTGSSKITPEDEAQLKQLAETATGTKGYIVEVTGYADATGNPAVNTKLSETRAKSAITYLVQQGRVPIRHIVAPGAMGEYGETATNETKEGRAENRRVEVKVLVNKGIAGI